MAGRAIYLGERSGARIFRVGRLGYDSAGTDAGSHAYTGTFRSERVAPAGPDGLINFRRVAIHLYATESYTYTVTVWVDGVQTTLGTGAAQTVTVSRTVTTAGEFTDEIAIAAYGNHIQVQITTSAGTNAPFLLETISAHGRVIRGTSDRVGRTS